VVSAAAGGGLDELLATAASRLDLEPRRVRLRFEAGDRRGVSGVYAAGRVLGREEEDSHVVLDVELPGRALERYREHRR
jgi:50S ribosomal subunit-associated GTPase HflX